MARYPEHGLSVAPVCNAANAKNLRPHMPASGCAGDVGGIGLAARNDGLEPDLPLQTLLRASLPALVLLSLVHRPAPAQEVRRTAVGGGLGVLAGVAVTAPVVVARAQWQNRYLHEPGDLIHWQSAPMILAPAAGVAFGLAGEDAHRGSSVGSFSGVVVGSAVGAGLGWLLSDEPEWTWAGGTIGGGFGMAIGGIAGGVLGWIGRDSDGGPAVPVQMVVRVPL